MLPSSFAVGTAAQAATATAALAAAEFGRLRNGLAQQVAAAMRHAALECCTHFLMNGQPLQLWDKLSGLYPCGGDAATGGWVQIHANFTHHRDGALRQLGLPEGRGAGPADVRRALQRWNVVDFEQAAANAGLVVAALRRFDAWDPHLQGRAVAQQPLLQWTRLGDAAPRAPPPLPLQARPLHGARVLDLTRTFARPVGTRALAAHGTDVLLVNSPKLPNIEAMAKTSRSKLSAHADLREPAGRAAFERVLGDAQAVVHGYRPGGLQHLGFGAEALALKHPGIVVVSLSAHGRSGPWSGRRGFDSLVQTASGVDHAQTLAFCHCAAHALPMQIQDHATGHLMALGACAALQRQQRGGGRNFAGAGFAGAHRPLAARPGPGGGRLGHRSAGFSPFVETTDSGFGRLSALRRAALLSATPAGWERPSMPPGTHPLAWPPTDGPRR